MGTILFNFYTDDYLILIKFDLILLQRSMFTIPIVALEIFFHTISISEFESN